MKLIEIDIYMVTQIKVLRLYQSTKDLKIWKCPSELISFTGKILKSEDTPVA